jgi:hypothetical protein
MGLYSLFENLLASLSDNIDLSNYTAVYRLVTANPFICLTDCRYMPYWGIVYIPIGERHALYEYRCHECGEVFEKMMHFSEADQNPACPNC